MTSLTLVRRIKEWVGVGKAAKKTPADRASRSGSAQSPKARN